MPVGQKQICSQSAACCERFEKSRGETQVAEVSILVFCGQDLASFAPWESLASPPSSLSVVFLLVPFAVGAGVGAQGQHVR